jgi:AcrR family transcriptional regulator
MKNEKDDRRVKYTKMVLKESFIKLLSEKEISQITIKEICEVADINRATFYAHYSDQYDLMRKIENELLENVGEYLAGYTKNEANLDHIAMVEKIFEYIKQNAELCRLLLSERGDLNFQKRIMMLIYERNIDDLTSGGGISKEVADYIYAFTITGCVGAIQKWLDDGMKKTPRFMAEMLVTLAGVMSYDFSERN